MTMTPTDLLVQTLQCTIAELGFIPDAHGDAIKKVIASGDIMQSLVLGLALECCIKEGSFDALDYWADQQKELSFREDAATVVR